MTELEAQRTQARALESRQLLIATLKAEEAQTNDDAASDSEMPDDTDDLDDESAIEAWKVP